LIGIPDQKLSEKLVVWPNPAKSIINIKSSLCGACRLVIYNSQGKVVLETENNDFIRNGTLDISRLAPGVYSLTLENEAERAMQRIVITR
jgi:hypothetical protein